MDRDGDDQCDGAPHPGQPRHRPESITLGGAKGQGKAQGDDQEDHGDPSPLSSSSGPLSSLFPSSPLDTDDDADDLLSSLEKAVFTQYSAGPVRLVRHRLAGVLTLQGLGLSRRHKLLVGWTALFCIALFLCREMLSLPPSVSRHHHDGADGAGIYASGFAARGHHIPAKIWQIMFVDPHSSGSGDEGEDEGEGSGSPSYDFEPDLISYSHTWLARNPDWQYTLVGTEGANRFVGRHFAHDQHMLLGMRNHGARSDVLRYLLLLVEGGVYADTDVTCLKPVDQWIPPKWRDKVRVVVGIEGDSMGQGIIAGMLWDVQFGQWT